MNFQSDFQQLTSNPWLSFSKAWSKSFKVPNISTEPIFLHVFKWPKTKLVCCCERPCLPREDYDLWSNFNPLSWSFCEACVSIPIIYTVVHQTLPTYTTSLSSHQGKNLRIFQTGIWATCLYILQQPCTLPSLVGQGIKYFKRQLYISFYTF